MINKAGIHGGTFFYVPTSFKYLFELGDSGMDGDASFNGAINGYIKAGLLLELELFGFDAAGAGALFGGGASCVVQDGYIDADVNGTVNIYDSWYKYPSSQDNIGEASNFIMVGAMRRYGEVQVPYEGATITIKAPSDADGNPRGEKTQYKDVNGLSMDRYLSRMFWATVSPTPEQDQLTEKISNFNALPGWSAAAAGNMVSKGFMDPGENRKFKSGNVSRAECAAYLTKAFGIISQPGRGKFTDIAPMNPYLPEINAAVSAGLISGYNANTFGSNDKVTREQMASIVMRGLRMKYGSTLSIPASTRQFADADKISSSTRTVAMEISALSIMNGDPNGTFKPKGFVTFNEMAVIINNLDGYVMKH